MKKTAQAKADCPVPLPANRRRTYRPPKLVVYGSVRDLTRGDSGSVFDLPITASRKYV